MAKFDVDVTGSLVSLDSLISKLTRVGTSLDNMERNAKKALSPALVAKDAFSDKMEERIRVLERLGGSNAKTANAMRELQSSVERTMFGMSEAYGGAIAKVNGYSGAQKELQHLLKNTDYLNEHIRHQRSLNTEMQRTENRARELAQTAKILETADGKAAAAAQVKTRSIRNVTTAEERLRAKERELTEQIRLGTSETQKNIDVLNRQQAANKIRERDATAAVTYLERQRAATAALNREMNFVNSKAGVEQIQLRQRIADTTREIARSAETQVKKNKQMRVGNQLTSSLRAGLQGAQTSIGMYTSSTIAAALATFSLVRAMKTTLDVGMEFTSTMARTNAIMGDNASLFATVESQVRLLGQTTSFTASQVSEAVTELGQAGLSAAESIIGLQPALDLAIIGNISLAKSADHATNLMSAFGKEAKDLDHIVNILATATTTANTTIDQLANALTYAGPAAKTAGFELEEMVAALDTLANSGIKSSKAGTAMRRLVVSLVNPTKKGTQVLEDYGISVTNLDGSFRSLSNIMNQFDSAFEGKGHERLSAIQDLVGVYAASPIATLMENNDKFNEQIALMGAMGDASQEMKNKINDSLTYDMKEVKSAFQELQLKVFKENEMQFRIWAQSLTNFLQYLGSTTERGTTVLNEMSSAFATMIKWAGAAFLGAKVIPAIIALGAGAITAGKAVGRFNAQLGVSAAIGGRSAAALSALPLLYGNVTRAANASAAAQAGAGAAAATGLRAAALGFARFIPYVGWAVLGGTALYQGYKAIWGKDSEIIAGMEDSETQVANITEQEQKLLDKNKLLRAEYKALVDISDKRKAAGTHANLIIQEEKLAEAISESTVRLTQYKTLRDSFDDGSTSRSYYANKVIIETNAIEKQVKALDELRKKLLGIEETNSKYRQAAEAIKSYQAAMNAPGNTIEQMEAYTRAIQHFSKIVAEIDNATFNKTKEGADLILEANRYIGKSFSELHVELTAENESEFEKYKKLRKNFEDKQAEHLALMEVIKEAGVLSNEQAAQFADGLSKTATAYHRAAQLFVPVTYDRNQSVSDYQSVKQDREFNQLSDAEQMTKLRERQVKASKELAALESVDIWARDTDQAAAKIEELNDIDSKIESIAQSQTKMAKSGVKAANTLANVYSSLYQQFDAVGFSADKLAEITGNLNTLTSNGEITQEQYNKALEQAEKNHHAVALQENKRLQLIKDMNSSYMSTGIDKEIDDLARLEKAYGDALISQKEKDGYRDRIFKGTENNADLPSMSISSQQSGGQFSDLMGTFSSATDGLRSIGKDQETIDKDKERAIARENIYMQEQIALADSEEAKLEILQEHGRRRDAIEDLSVQKSMANDTRRQKFSEQSNLLVMASMADTMGSMLGMIASAGEDATAAQKIAFVAQKALAVASILIQTHVGAAMAVGQLGPFGIPLSTAIMATGYASAGMVAGMAIGELAGSGGGGGGDYAGAYDNGGYIPAGKFGIVGEIGPEIVNGPANVTSRKDTAKLLKGGSSDTSGPQQVTIAPVIQIEYTSEGSSQDSKEDGQAMGNAIKMVVLNTIQNELRPNGMLYRR